MLQLSTTTQEGCDEFSFTDATGLYSLLTNPSGYGPENGIDGPADFDTYVLNIRKPHTAITDPPDYVFNLLTTVPAPDSDDHYTWVITGADLGITTFPSGVWTFTAIGTLASVQYISDSQCIFVKQLEALVDAAMLDYDPTCPCKDGCANPADLFVEMLTIKCGGVCDRDRVQAIIDSLLSKLPTCC